MKKKQGYRISPKWHWKTSYTLVLIANAVYIILFYFMMQENC
ncbi:hypothetical protein [Sinomicrobium soli]|nr:hypothetical protein [Sinomicrobium sp. N-1-3-6]